MRNPVPIGFLLAALTVTATFAAIPPEPVEPFDSNQEFSVRNRIDELLAARWKEQGITPALICSDAVFLRRVYLDLIGTLPTESEARKFLEDRDPRKRERLIDELLNRPEYADYWTMRWGDVLRIKAEFPINLWPNAVQAYNRWLYSSLARNKPYDQFVRELLTSSGSNFRVGPVNFYRATQDRSPKGIAQVVALTFMGVRTDQWPREKLEGMAAFFSQISFKPTMGMERGDRELGSLRWQRRNTAGSAQGSDVS